MNDPWSVGFMDISVRLVSAVILGGVIGMEREQRNHAAGFRTHILVCLGSALIMLLSLYGFAAFANEPNVRLDPARLAAQVISGIGFLGAGTILRHGISITGLTTAASLWVVAAIGLAVGAGFYLSACISTLLVLLCLMVLNKVEKKLFQGRRLHLIKLEVQDRPGVLGQVSALLESKRIEILKVLMDEQDEDLGKISISLHVKVSRKESMMELIDGLINLKYVHSVSYE